MQSCNDKFILKSVGCSNVRSLGSSLPKNMIGQVCEPDMVKILKNGLRASIMISAAPKVQRREASYDANIHATNNSSERCVRRRYLGVGLLRFSRSARAAEAKHRFHHCRRHGLRGYFMQRSTRLHDAEHRSHCHAGCAFFPSVRQLAGLHSIARCYHNRPVPSQIAGRNGREWKSRLQ